MICSRNLFAEEPRQGSNYMIATGKMNRYDVLYHRFLLLLGRFATDGLRNEIPEFNVHMMTTKALRIMRIDHGKPIATVIHMVKILLSEV